MSATSDQRYVRGCYGQLAGVLGVAVADALIERGILRVSSQTARRCLDGT
ncbi:MAG: hypothetical protein WCK65_03950 [Rhodospirillaceae bacterium]